MRDDPAFRIPLIDHRLEDLNAMFPILRAAQTPDQLLALSRKHWSDDHFDPTHVALDDVHVVRCLRALAYHSNSKSEPSSALKARGEPIKTQVANQYSRSRQNWFIVEWDVDPELRVTTMGRGIWQAYLVGVLLSVSLLTMPNRTAKIAAAAQPVSSHQQE